MSSHVAHERALPSPRVAHGRRTLPSPRVALALGLAGFAAAIAMTASGVGELWYPYLFAFVLCLGLGLGAEAILLIHRLTGGRWGRCVRRPLEAMTSTVPAIALFFVPIALAMDAIYPWLAHGSDEIVDAKVGWLNRDFFLARAAFYLVIWSVIAVSLVRAKPSPSDADRRSRPLIVLACAGLIVHVLTVGFAAVDWIASLEPRWYSSIFGFNVVAAQALGAMALITALACASASSLDPLTEEARERLNDLGNLLLMFVTFDAYLSFVQFFIAWNGNLPNHVVWYVPRMTGFWGAAGVAMIALQFAAPLVLLLFRAIKRNPRRLLVVALIVLAGRVIDSAWLVLPGKVRAPSLDLVVAAACLLGIGGFFAAVFLWRCRRSLEVAR